MKTIRTMAAACVLLGALAARANNIAVTNVTMRNLVPSQNAVDVQFDLSWENSWRLSTAEANWDAAWVFIKYRLDGETDWQHAYLSTNDADHRVPAPGTFRTGLTGTNGMGVFIYRSSAGTGDVNYQGVRLRWTFPDAAVEKNDDVELFVSAIEMVYVPEGPFHLGDGSTDPNGNFETGLTGAPFLVTNESYAITLGGGGDGSLGNNGGPGAGFGLHTDDFDDTTSKTLPAAFPKGYAAFYIMKTELSQGQYADFLTLLTDAQDDNNFSAGAGRYTITGSYSNYTATAPNRACHRVDWLKSAAYADWSGLRPITELEYEKACRGPNPPVADEYAWGSTAIYTLDYTLSNDGQADAVVDNPGSDTGNALYQVTDDVCGAPLRCGIFAASTSNPTREEAGGTYYGVLEMSGNLWEQAIVSVGTTGGRAFTGTHGDGVLSADGRATNSDWPGYSGGKVSSQNSVGIGARGGYWGHAAKDLRVSRRRNFTYQYNDWLYWYGWRGGRTAP